MADRNRKGGFTGRIIHVIIILFMCKLGFCCKKGKDMNAERITSRQNALIQQVRRLRTSRSERYKTGLFCADGTKLLLEAIRWCDGLHTVLLSEETEVPALPEHVRV